ncbi:MAG: polysaccharide biosynthesis protein [Peptococcaceae bacterium]|nr:polysaccharide biosynthesis protein [Peptococcaceae bacterium]
MANRLIVGAAILFGANLVNKIMGFVYQYLIMHYIGSEAFGLYQMAFPVYMTTLVFTTAGLPLAVAKMVSEKISLGAPQDARKIFHTALLILFVSGTLVTLLVYLNIPIISTEFFPDKRVGMIFKICIPSVLIVSVSSGFRGYFQGLQNMLPSATSQIVGQIARVGLGFYAAWLLLPMGVEWAACGLALGMVAAELIALIMIMIFYVWQRSQDKKRVYQPHRMRYRHICKDLFTLSVPTTGSRLAASLLSTLDTLIIPRQLGKAGYSISESTSLFGQLNGTALTLLTFPNVFTFALATSLVPAISAAMARKNYQLAGSRCNDAIRATVLLGLPCAIFLFIFADILSGVFKSPQIAPALQIMAATGLFTYLMQTTTGILQGVGKMHVPLVHSLVGAFIRIPLLFYLTAQPELGILGCALTYSINSVIVTSLNFAAILRYIKVKFNYVKLFGKPLLAAAAMFASMIAMKSVLGGQSLLSFATALLILSIGFAVYVGVLWLIKGISSKDLSILPWFNKVPRA